MAEAIVIIIDHPVTTILVLIAIAAIVRSIKVAQEYERAVMFRIGRQTDVRGPGLFLKIPIVERAAFVDIRVVTHELEKQEAVTKDGVAVRANAIVWYRANDPVKTIVTVRDWNFAVQQAAETALRDTIGQNELDQLLNERGGANQTLLRVLSLRVEVWGVGIDGAELKDLEIPDTMQRAIAREAEAVREKRARIIKADGEAEAAKKLAEAAATMTPGAIRLRELQMISEVGIENSTIVIVATGDQTIATAAGVSRAFGQDRATAPNNPTS